MNVLMPQLGETVTEGTVANWHKKVGDNVAADEIILDIETDKVSMEIPAPAAGVITEILVPAGTHRRRRHRARRRSRAARAQPPTPPAAQAAAAAHDAARRRRGASPPPSWYAAMPPASNDAAASRSAAAAALPRRTARRQPTPSRATSHQRLSPAVRRLAAEYRLDLDGRSGLGPQRPHHAAQRARVHRGQRSERSRAGVAAPSRLPRRTAAAPAPAAPAPDSGARGRAAGRREDAAVHAHPQAHGRAHGALEGDEPARAASRRGRLPPRRSACARPCATRGRRSTATR